MIETNPRIKTECNRGQLLISGHVYLDSGKPSNFRCFDSNESGLRETI